ncbi:MAG: hypothetical protein U0794_05345 [Isosphaeraceae bacterium]
MLASVVFANGFTGKNATAGAESIAVDSAGNSYVTGNFNGLVTFGATSLKSVGANDMYIAKIDPVGSVLWVKRLGSSTIADGDYGRSVAIDAAGNVYATGFFSGVGDVGGVTVPNSGGRDIVVAKLDTNGNTVWAKSFGGGNNDLGQAIAVDSSGGLYLTGSFQGSVVFGGTTLVSSGSTDTFVAKLDQTAGNVAWAKRMGGVGQDSAFSISVDGAGSVFTTGIFSNTASFGPSITKTSAGDTDIFVTKMDNNGNVLWTSAFGGLGHDDGTAVVQDGAGGVYLTGDIIGNVAFGSTVLYNASLTGTNDAFVARLNASGNVVWAKNFGGPQYDAGFHITRDSVGNVYTTGVFQATGSFPWLGTVLTSNGDYDVYIVKMDPNGNVLSAESYGSTAGDQAYQVAVGGPSNNLYTVGNYGAAINFGSTGLPGPGGAYVVQFGVTNNTGNSRAPSDFDGLGRTQMAVYRPSAAQWYVMGGNNIGRLFGTFGAINLYDIPVAGDFLGIGRSQMAVFRPTTAEWFVMGPNGGQSLGAFGATGLFDIPIVGDFLGLGRAQIGVFRPSTAEWFVMGPNGGQRLGSFGATGLFDIPVPGDYLGLGRSQMAVFRPSTAEWFVMGPNGGQSLGTFGSPNFVDIPAPGDYDGIGRTQLGVFRVNTATYYVNRAGVPTVLGAFGAPYLFDLPTQTNVAALLKLGKISSGGIGRGLGAMALTGGTTSVSTGSGITAANTTGATTRSTGQVNTPPAATLALNLAARARRSVLQAPNSPSSARRSFVD